MSFSKIDIRILGVFICFIFISKVIYGQEHDHDNDHKAHHHEGHVYELGFSPSITLIKPEDETAPSLHLHAHRRLGSENFKQRLSVGLGVETIFTEHLHYSLLASFSYNPFAAFIIDVSPGILFVEEEDESIREYLTHIELTYEFDLGQIGIGPVVGMALSSEDTHYMVGVHIGKGL
ncbi:hypothetical protein JXQ31_20820 [candidate division KSB1 bacterium]|nr:hypothetical protein [candidate division KSB1 bacterium]